MRYLVQTITTKTLVTSSKANGATATTRIDGASSELGTKRFHHRGVGVSFFFCLTAGSADCGSSWRGAGEVTLLAKILAISTRSAMRGELRIIACTRRRSSGF